MSDLRKSKVVAVAALLIAVPLLVGETHAHDQEDQGEAPAGQTPPAVSAPDERRPIVGVSPREELYGPFSDVGFLKSVPLFGSDWRFSFGGYVKLDVLTDFAGTGDEFQFVTPTIPVNGTPPPGSYSNIHAKETRFSFEMRNTREGIPFNKAFIEMDFFDETSTAPRLRHAYFQWGNFLAGQTWATLTAIDMLPFLLDFAYGDALYAGRQALVRWEQHKPEGKISWAVALEDWDADSVSNPFDLPGEARYTVPLIAVRGAYKWKRGNGFVGGSVSQLRWDGTGAVPDDTVPAWSLVTAWRVYIDSDRQSYFGFGGAIGDGSGGNTVNLSEGGNANAVLRPDGTLDPIPYWTAQVALHYEFSSKWSTNANVAWGVLDPVPFRGPSELKASGSAHLNLIRHIAPEFLVGAEVMYGERVNTDDADGTATRIQFSAMFSF